jgi:hypothetical protein
MQERLRAALKELRNKMPHNNGKPLMGCELEGFFVDEQDGSLSHIAPELLPAMIAKGIANRELGTAQFEINLQPQPVGRWDAWREELNAKLAILIETAKPYGARLEFIGMPETLRPADLGADRVYPTTRMRRIDQEWQQAWRVCQLNGNSRVELSPSSIAFSGVMAATQLHLQLPADEEQAASVYNRCLVATSIALGHFSNSRCFLGSRDFAEHRIPLCEDQVDAGRGRIFFPPPAQISIMEILEFYVEDLPFVDLGETVEDDLALLKAHVKNIWPWLRVIPERDHLRVEVRAFPSLPPERMFELAEYFYRLVFSMPEPTEAELANARIRFYKAAQHGS